MAQERLQMINLLLTNNLTLLVSITLDFNELNWSPARDKDTTKHCIAPALYRVSLVSWWRHQMETFSALLAFVRGIHRSPVNSPHKGQWRGTFMFSLISTRTNGWVNNLHAGDLRRHRAHYDVTLMFLTKCAAELFIIMGNNSCSH